MKIELTNEEAIAVGALLVEAFAAVIESAQEQAYEEGAEDGWEAFSLALDEATLTAEDEAYYRELLGEEDCEPGGTDDDEDDSSDKPVPNPWEGRRVTCANRIVGIQGTEHRVAFGSEEEAAHFARGVAYLIDGVVEWPDPFNPEEQDDDAGGSE